MGPRKAKELMKLRSKKMVVTLRKISFKICQWEMKTSVGNGLGISRLRSCRVLAEFVVFFFIQRPKILSGEIRRHFFSRF